MPKTRVLKQIDRTHYKYCILSMYNNLTPEKKREFKRSLDINDISVSSFHVYCNIPFYSSQDIPAGKLQIMALFFGVTSDFLKNYSFKISPKNEYKVLQTSK